MLLTFPQPLGSPNEMPGIADSGLTSALEPTVSSGGTGTVEGRRCDDLVTFRIGGFTTHLKKYDRQMGSSSPGKGEH